MLVPARRAAAAALIILAACGEGSTPLDPAAAVPPGIAPGLRQSGRTEQAARHERLARRLARALRDDPFRAAVYQQLRRIALPVGGRAEFDVAWLDDGVETLTALPQIYERRTETTYWYESPQGPYTATLQIAENGFALVYPGLWEMED